MTAVRERTTTSDERDARRSLVMAEQQPPRRAPERTDRDAVGEQQSPRRVPERTDREPDDRRQPPDKAPTAPAERSDLDDEPSKRRD